MELIIQIAGTQLHKRCNFEGNSCTGSGVMKVADTGIQFFMQFHRKRCIVCLFIIKFQCLGTGFSIRVTFSINDRIDWGL
ncbi:MULTISPECIES: hypothetical protein [Wolbachia]|uniref:hypothetical protein n=1 Tax=Wolbachia TaxID=953 RepID=UPI0005A06B59|nr:MULTISPECIES: hypothetical protein [Wolbachia]MBH5362267.1 hypothetical protein [Wolbachia endosymbiont of Kradibia gibbosae]GKS80136.1 hypothetical protein wHmb_10220 [Wolbachia pipientis]